MRHQLNARRVCVILIFLSAFTIIYKYVLHVKKERRDFIQNYYIDEVEDEKSKKSIKQRMYTKTMNKIRAHIKNFNTKQVIHNSYLGPITVKTFVIVINCHSNVYHIKRLLSSLKKAYFINSALLIFSHDYYSAKINKVIEKIDFAQYMQIFYPYSIQLHLKVFPGVEPRSYVEGLPYMKSTSRDPEAAQSKHHWWWQANQIFDHLSALKKFTQPILFLEANNYVIIDFLFVYRLLVNARFTHCPFCEIISLAAHDPDLFRYRKRKSFITLEAWKKTIPSTAIAFDRKIWQAIKTWKELFCYYNDAKWDNSLKHLGAVKMDGNFYLAAIDGPRVFSIEECDVKDVGCKERDKVESVKNFTKEITRHMFPLSLRIKIMPDEDYELNESGDWSDVRDHELCMRFANESVWFIK